MRACGGVRTRSYRNVPVDTCTQVFRVAPLTQVAPVDTFVECIDDPVLRKLEEMDKKAI